MVSGLAHPLKIKIPARSSHDRRSEPSVRPSWRPHAFLFSAWLSGAETQHVRLEATLVVGSPSLSLRTTASLVLPVGSRPPLVPECNQAANPGALDTNTIYAHTHARARTQTYASARTYFHYRGRGGDNNQAPLGRAKGRRRVRTAKSHVENVSISSIIAKSD